MIKTFYNSLKKFSITVLLAASVIFLAACSASVGTDPKDYGDASPAAITAKTNEAFVAANTSVEMAKAMKIGWNLGNTFDAWANGVTGLASETCWGQPKTTKAMLQGIKQAGFASIRIPVSWHDHITDSTNYTLETAWINRVKEVVDWALEEGLCVIINIHHDNFSDAELANRDYGFAVSKDSELQEKSKKYIAGVWKNLAEVFKDYDHSLVFELLNEPRDIGGTNWGNEWYVDSSNATEANGIILSYEKAALELIRESGSKNADRFIMVPPYAASTGCMGGFDISKLSDSAEDRIIIEGHAYSPYNFAMKSEDGETKFTSAHKNELKGTFNNLYNNYVSKGIGLVIDETGATNKNNLEDRIAWAEYFFGEAYKKGIPAFWWDNGNWQVSGSDYNEKYGYYNRNQQIWYFPSLMKASLMAVGVEFEANTDDAEATASGDKGENTGDDDSNDEPDSADYTKEDLVILSDKKTVITNGYASFNLDAAVDLTDYKYLKAEIYSPNADGADSRKLGLQFFNSDWKSIGSAETFAVSDTIYAELSNPENGNREVKIIQYFAQDTTKWDTIDGITIEIQSITATNTKD